MLSFASKWGLRLENWIASTIGEVIQWCIDPNSRPRMQGMDDRLTSAILCTLLYCYWNYINSFIFGKPEKMEALVLKLNFLVDELVEAQGRISDQVIQHRRDRRLPLAEAWTPPSDGWIKVNMDAACKQGKSALGLIALDTRGKLLIMASKVVNCENSQVAELMAIEWATKVIMNQS